MSDTEFNEAITAIANDMQLPREWTEGVIRSLGLAHKIAGNLEDYTACVAVQFLHSHADAVGLMRKIPDTALPVYPESERAIGREDG